MHFLQIFYLEQFFSNGFMWKKNSWKNWNAFFIKKKKNLQTEDIYGFCELDFYKLWMQAEFGPIIVFSNLVFFSFSQHSVE